MYSYEYNAVTLVKLALLVAMLAFLLKENINV